MFWELKSPPAADWLCNWAHRVKGEGAKLLEPEIKVRLETSKLVAVCLKTHRTLWVELEALRITQDLGSQIWVFNTDCWSPAMEL